MLRMQRALKRDIPVLRKFLLSAGAAAIVFGCAVAPEPVAEAPPPVYPPPPEHPRYYYDRTILSSADVVEDTAKDRFRRFATGESIRGRGFDKPFDVEVAGGRIFVSDTVARRVYALDFARRDFYELGTDGMGRLVKPLGLAVDGAGRLYVADGAAKRVVVFNYDGEYVTAVASDEFLERPSSVAVNADGSRIYIVDTGGVSSRDHRIRVFDFSGAHLFDIGTRGGENGEFNLPLSAAVAPNGDLHVLDTGNFRVQVFSPDGAFKFSFGAAGRRPGLFSHPKGISIDREGKVFVTDTAFGNFQIFDSAGRILMFIGDRDERGGPGKFILPAGIDVDESGRIYVVDQFFRKIDVFRPAALPAEAPIGAQAADLQAKE